MTQKINKASESVTMAVHQMKNPIYVLKGYLEALFYEEVGELNTKQKEYISDSMENIDRVTNIIGDLLRILEIEEKEYEVKHKPIDLVKVVSDVIENHALLAKAANTVVHFDVPSNIPLVSTDPIKINHVVENLLLNAIKYKQQGERSVYINIQEKENEVLFSIKDEGVGINEEDGDTVFSKFFRSKKAIEIDPTGLGLGLYISKAIIDLSGGKIWFENNEGDGVIFHFTLPKYNE